MLSYESPLLKSALIVMVPNGPYARTIEEHTHHKAGSGGNQCVACHMPAIETEGVPSAFVHAHTFRFISPP